MQIDGQIIAIEKNPLILDKIEFFFSISVLFVSLIGKYAMHSK